MSLITVDVSSVNDIHTDLNQFSESFDSIKFVLSEDVTDMKLYISTKVDGEVDIISEDSASIIRGKDYTIGKEYLVWKLASPVTTTSGVVYYQIVGAKLKDDGTYDAVWLSDEGRIVVKDSIDADDYVVKTAKKSPSLFMSLYLILEKYLNKALIGEFNGAIKLNGAGTKTLPEANYKNHGKIITMYSDASGDKIYMCTFVGYNDKGDKTYKWKELAFVEEEIEDDPDIPPIEIE